VTLQIAGNQPNAQQYDSKPAIIYAHWYPVNASYRDATSEQLTERHNG
jgi:hypothetical protein